MCNIPHAYLLTFSLFICSEHFLFFFSCPLGVLIKTDLDSNGSLDRPFPNPDPKPTIPPPLPLMAARCPPVVELPELMLLMLLLLPWLLLLFDAWFSSEMEIRGRQRRVGWMVKSCGDPRPLSMERL